MTWSKGALNILDEERNQALKSVSQHVTELSLSNVSIIVDASIEAFCTEHGLTRGRTNHNFKNRVTYLTCNLDGYDAKFWVIKIWIPTSIN